MNKEVIKAMNKKEEKETTIKKIKKWWNKNGYKILRVILFPVWGCVVVKEKYNQWIVKKNKWNEERAKEILDYYVPRSSEWNEETKSFYLFDNGYGWGSKYNIKKYINRKDRNFWKVNCGTFGSNMRKFLIDKYELEWFNKKTLDCSDGYTEIIFKLNEDDVNK